MVDVDGKIVGRRVVEDDIDFGVVLCCKDNEGSSIGVGPSLHDIFWLEGMGGDDGGGSSVGAEGVEVDVGTVGSLDVDAFTEDGVCKRGMDVVGR